MAAPVAVLNAGMASASDSGGYANETKDYLGVIKQMRWVEGQEQSGNYLIHFESIEGQSADGLYINYIKKDGTLNELGVKQISALLCCLGLREAKPVMSTVVADIYDEAKQAYVEKTINAEVFPDVCGRPIGLVLQKELTTRQKDGADSYRMILAKPFHAETKRTAAEMLAASRAAKEGQEVKQPYVLNALLSTIRDKDSRRKNGQQNAGNGNAAQTGGNQSLTPQQEQQAQMIAQATKDFDDDIPF